MYGVRICCFNTSSGEGVDRNGRTWRWDFSPQFGPVFIDKHGRPLKAQPVSENHVVWPVFNAWYAKLKQDA